MRRLSPLIVLLALVVSVPAWVGLAGAAPAAAKRSDLDAYRGLGTWVDVYDYVPQFQDPGQVPSVTAASFDDMARLGVKTVYLQAAQDDSRSPGDTIDPKLLGRMLRAAHDAGLRVVAWYLPRFGDIGADLRRIRALLDLKTSGQRFDGLAVDIEWNKGVPDNDARNSALVDLSRRIRRAAGDRPVGAIVLEPVFLEDVSPDYWPDFPWRKIAGLYDVWMPTNYWTNRNSDSGYKEGFRYTDENIRRVRSNLRKRDAPVHAIGGIADAARAKDYEGFVRAAKKDGAIGWSVYDYSTTVSTAWPRLRAR